MSNTKVKLDLFFPQKGESMDNPLGKYERNQMIISSSVAEPEPTGDEVL